VEPFIQDQKKGRLREWAYQRQGMGGAIVQANMEFSHRSQKGTELRQTENELALSGPTRGCDILGESLPVFLQIMNERLP
jgi:hypothetical protein